MPSDTRQVPAGHAELSRQLMTPDVSNAMLRTWHDDTRVRAIQFEETLDAAARGAIIPVVVAGGLLAVFWSSPVRPYAAALLVLVLVAGLAAVIASRADICRKASPRGIAIGRRVALALAALMGLTWGAAALVLFAPSNADQRLIVVVAVTVVLGCVYRLGPIRGTNVLFVVPICVGSIIGFAQGHSLAALALAAIVPFYGWFLLAHSRRFNAMAEQRAIYRISVGEQNHAIHELLLDFDETSSDWLWRTNADGRFVNVAAGIAVVFPLGNLEGAKFESLFSRLGGASAAKGTHFVLAAFAARKPFRNQLLEMQGDGSSRWWRVSGKPFYDEAGRFSGYRGVGSDMTGALNSESRISYLANHDALTGLANRANFQTFVSRQCAEAAKDGHARALVCVDLDDFKTVNDSLGHEGGDELLRHVAVRLTAAAPAGTFVARLGGDEFALLFQAITPSKAEAAAQALIEALRVPFDISGLQLNLGASVGIAFTPKHAVDPDDLLVKADLALYRAKAEGKGQVCVFKPDFEATLIDRRKLEGDLKLALARGEFVLHYQPIVDVALGRIVSFEALIRWQSPDRGFVSPAEFIPAAESLGLIAAIGRWVLFEACRAAATWPADIAVAVNVSPPQMRSADFMQDVVVALKTSGLHPSRLEIEVTEGVLLDKSFAALDALRTLRTRGVRIALDDFGTGYSSMNYLIDFPVDKIKIDRSFVSDFVESYANRAIVEAMLGLARKLSIRVTAEGVETKEQALALKRCRCDELQGYLLSRPRPEGDVPTMIATVPGLFREAIPTYMDSPLAMALITNRSTSSVGTRPIRI